MGTCKDCRDFDGRRCHRYPDQPLKNNGEWCREWEKQTKVVEDNKE